jgi:4,5-DOPA dioxygenase extradiol
VILVASAHWLTHSPTVSAMETNRTIYDFYGFPPELYTLDYPAPGAPALAEKVLDLLAAAGLASRIDPRRGLDHGAWVPLSLMYPDADVPVVQLSLQGGLGLAHHRQVGQVLADLRKDNVLIVGSGSFTHDLSRIQRSSVDVAASPDVDEFADWMDQALRDRRVADLLAYRRLAPHAERNHPSEEHILPLFVALGASGSQPAVEHLHRSTLYGVLRMDGYAFR